MEECLRGYVSILACLGITFLQIDLCMRNSLGTILFGISMRAVTSWACWTLYSSGGDFDSLLQAIGLLDI